MGAQIGKALDIDTKLADMPQVRLVQKPLRDRNSFFQMAPA